MPSFTIRVPNLAQAGPVVEVQAVPSDLYIQKFGAPHPPTSGVMLIRALFDTGASGSVIQTGIPRLLNLNPVGFTILSTASSRQIACLQYDLKLVLPNNVGVDGVFAELDLPGQSVQCLIRRDVLQHAVLIYTGYDNSYTFSV